uniref:Uncharacterized protein n=1 Tax=Chromera velia CCMP2878 TaxID=1169474 RepID=A0A0G4FBG6_9ALVE|eukprot:Cvel_16148.t1-p1 / transcript=Cvel_16148.t1 / gene=Cvel_16148 / organism=Chromera_velia_CCMP2878 / gene_product=hypothetical protein / transcript_product=hypothetical protein / location=Cvel_scaffold1230:3913-4422(-) / protein_length=170 / sequence_SO=supercontig / SO=protein_coding / is_pseudo=false
MLLLGPSHHHNNPQPRPSLLVDTNFRRVAGNRIPLLTQNASTMEGTQSLPPGMPAERRLGVGVGEVPLATLGALHLLSIVLTERMVGPSVGQPELMRAAGRERERDIVRREESRGTYQNFGEGGEDLEGRDSGEGDGGSGCEEGAELWWMGEEEEGDESEYEEEDDEKMS